MKRFLLTIGVCLSFMMSWAQVDARYDKGSVPMVNGRVLFQKSVATSLDQETSFNCINEWA